MHSRGHEKLCFMLSDIYLFGRCYWCKPLMDNCIVVTNCVCWRYIHLKQFLSTPYVCKSLCPGGTKLQKAIFSIKVTVKVIDLGVIWKGIISGVCMPNIKSFSLAAQCLQLRLKLTTDKTNIQDKKYVSHYLIQGNKKCNTGEHCLFSKSKVTTAGMKIQPMPIISVHRSWPKLTRTCRKFPICDDKITENDRCLIGLCNIIGLPIYCNILVSNTYCNTFFRIAILLCFNPYYPLATALEGI